MRGVATPGCRKQEKAARTQTRAAATAADNKAPRQKQEATKRADWPEAPEAVLRNGREQTTWN